MTQSASGTISVQCKCGKKLKAPATAVGRKAKCPNCGNVLTVQVPQPRPSDDIDDALYDLAGQEQVAAKTAQPATPTCPNCYTPMESGAVLCTSCGYDTRTGKTLGTVAPPVAAAVAKPKAAASGTRFIPGMKTNVEVEKPKPTGSLIKGTIISAVLASIGAFVWFGIAKATGFEIGWIAWGVGIAAGIGMMAGYNGTSVHSGAIAAAVAVGGILLAKFMMMIWLLPAGVDKGMDNELGKYSDDQKLMIFTVFEVLKSKGLSLEDATEPEKVAARAEATKQIAKMDAPTRATKLKEGRESLKEYGMNKIMSEHKGDIYKELFSPMDLVFIVIAIASAFKMATFGGQVQN